MKLQIVLAAALLLGAVLTPVTPALPSGTYVSEDGAELLLVESRDGRAYVTIERPLLCNRGSWCSTVVHPSGATTYASRDGETGRPTADAILDVSAGARSPVLAAWGTRPVRIPFRHVSSPDEARRALEDLEERSWFQGGWSCRSDGARCSTMLELGGDGGAGLSWSTSCTRPVEGKATVLSATRARVAAPASDRRGSVTERRTVRVETDAERFLQRFTLARPSRAGERDPSVELWLGEVGAGAAFATCTHR